MTEPIAAPSPTAAGLGPAGPEVASVQSTALLRGGRELLIRHQGETYRLRRTSNDKLILTK